MARRVYIGQTDHDGGQVTVPTIEPAYHLWCEISNAVEDFVTGMVCVMRGDFASAHLWFYAAKMTREEPRA